MINLPGWIIQSMKFVVHDVTHSTSFTLYSLFRYGIQHGFVQTKKKSETQNCILVNVLLVQFSGQKSGSQLKPEALGSILNNSTDFISLILPTCLFQYTPSNIMNLGNKCRDMQSVSFPGQTLFESKLHPRCFDVKFMHICNSSLDYAPSSLIPGQHSLGMRLHSRMHTVAIDVRSLAC